MWIRRWMSVGGWICGCLSVWVSLSLKKGPWLLEQWLQWNYFLTWYPLDAASRCLWRHVWPIDIWLESHLMGWIIEMKLVSCGHKGRLGVLSVGSLRITLPPVTNLTNTSVVTITIRAEQGSHHFIDPSYQPVDLRLVRHVRGIVLFLQQWIFFALNWINLWRLESIIDHLASPKTWLIP